MRTTQPFAEAVVMAHVELFRAEAEALGERRACALLGARIADAGRVLHTNLAAVLATVNTVLNCYDAMYGEDGAA